MDDGNIIAKANPLIELDFTTEEKLEELLNQEEEQLSPENNEELKNFMKDLQDIRGGSSQDFSEAELEAQQLQKIAEENQQSIQELRDNEIEGFEDKSNTEEQDSEKEKQQDSETKKNTYSGDKVTVSCNIPGRKCYTGKPTYECKAGGKIYIEIKVDKVGRVRSAKLIPSKSSTDNECLVEKALSYAKNRTSSNSDLKGKSLQKGYIIYNFIKQ